MRRGLVTRTRSNTNNREVTVQLTRAGRDMVEQLIPLMVRLETVLFKGVSAKELATFKKILRLMYANMAGYRGNGVGPGKRKSGR